MKIEHYINLSSYSEELVKKLQSYLTKPVKSFDHRKNNVGKLGFSVTLAEDSQGYQMIKKEISQLSHNDLSILDRVIYRYTEEELLNADYINIATQGRAAVNLGYIINENGALKTYTEEAVAKKFNLNPTDLAFGLVEPHNLTGFTITKDIGSYNDIINPEMIHFGHICSQKFKDISDENGFTGVRFIPIWRNGQIDLQNPHWYLMKATNFVKLNTILNIRPSVDADVVKYTMLDQDQKRSLQDFNAYDLGGITEKRMLIEKSTTVSIISQRVFVALLQGGINGIRLEESVVVNFGA